MIAWGNKVPVEFRTKIVELCSRLWGADSRYPSWLMACMAFESGLTFSPSVRNPASSAVGLIQFMSGTAAELGTTTSALAKMTAVEQLDWVEKYFRLYGWYKKITSLDDMYMRILWPRAIGQPDNYPLWSISSSAYRVNAGLDTDNNGIITKHEAVGKVRVLFNQGLLPENSA